MIVNIALECTALVILLLSLCGGLWSLKPLFLKPVSSWNPHDRLVVAIMTLSLAPRLVFAIDCILSINRIVTAGFIGLSDSSLLFSPLFSGPATLEFLALFFVSKLAALRYKKLYQGQVNVTTSRIISIYTNVLIGLLSIISGLSYALANTLGWDSQLPWLRFVLVMIFSISQAVLLQFLDNRSTNKVLKQVAIQPGRVITVEDKTEHVAGTSGAARNN